MFLGRAESEIVRKDVVLPGFGANKLETVTEINAITLVTRQMASAVAFWKVLNLPITYGGPDSAFTSLRIGANFVNLVAAESSATVEVADGSESVPFWGRVVFHVESPDEVWSDFKQAGYAPTTDPADAPWGERYFHISDPDGHELSFARRL